MIQDTPKIIPDDLMAFTIDEPDYNTYLFEHLSDEVYYNELD